MFLFECDNVVLKSRPSDMCGGKDETYISPFTADHDNRRFNLFYSAIKSLLLGKKCVPMSPPAVRFRIPLGAGFSGKYHVSPLSILGYWGNEYLIGRDGNVYDKFNAPKWLQDCMLSVGMRWHMNDQVQ